MATVVRQRLFNAVFPPDELPLISKAPENELPQQLQKQWDVVTRVLRPSFSLENFRPDFEEGNPQRRMSMTCRMV